MNSTHAFYQRIILIVVFLSLGLTPLTRAEDKGMNYPISAWPIVFHEEDKDKGQTDVIWPFYRHEWRGQWERYALRPLIFSTESDPSRDFRKTSVLWPLNNYLREGATLDMNIMPYFHGRDANRTYTTLFPVYWQREGKDYNYLHVWPLFGVYNRDTYSNYSSLYPFFQYGLDPAGDEVDVDLFWPVMNYHSRPGYISHRILPVYMYEKGNETSSGYVFPYYFSDTPTFHARGIFPLWYSSRGPEQKTDVVFPVFFNKESADGGYSVFFPVYGHWYDKQSSIRMVMPVYFDYQKPDFSMRVGFPIYWDYKEGDFSLTSLVPVYWDYRDGSYTVKSVLPLYYHTHDTDLRSDFEYYFPVYGTYSIGDTYTRHLLFMPLYSQYRDEALKVEGRDILWPLLNYESGPDRYAGRVFPLLWIKHSPETDLRIVLPFYYSYKDTEKSYLHIFPFYGKHIIGKTFEQTYHLGPVYVETRDSAQDLDRTDILFPLFSRLRQGENSRTWLFPLYFHKESAGSHTTFASPCLLPPYYYTYHNSTGAGYNLWPLYSYSDINGYTDYGTFWPFIRYGHNQDYTRTKTQILLFYRDMDQSKTKTGIFPLWWHADTSSSVSDSTLFLHTYERRSDIDSTGFALIWIGSEKCGVFTYSRDGDNALATRFLYRVVSYERTSRDESEFRFLWRFIRTSSTPAKDIFEFNPIYYHETDKGVASYWALFGGLIGCRTEASGELTMRYLWVF